MSDHERASSPFDHPFMPPIEYEHFKDIIDLQTKVIFPDKDAIKAVFKSQGDILRVFGKTEEEALARLAHTEVSGLEVAYFLTDLFMAFTPRRVEDIRQFARDLVEEQGVNNLEMLKQASRQRQTATYNRGIEEARILVGGLIGDPQAKEDAEDYFSTLQANVNKA